MTALAERLAPRLTGMMEHPGNESTKPFHLAPLAAFQTATLPPGQAQQEAELAGLPHPNFALIWLEAVVHLLQTEGNVTLVDNAELADLRAAAAVNEGKRNRIIEFHTECGLPAFRVMVKGFDSDHPRVPCAAVAGHECGVK